MVSILASGPSRPRFESQLSAFSEEIFLDAEVSLLCWLEESGQWRENVDRTHFVLASVKPVLQKRK